MSSGLYLRGTPLVRLSARTEQVGECWLWTGRVNRSGYGEMKISGRVHMVHRVSYEYRIGPIPQGLHLDHLCHTVTCAGGVTDPHRRCVNPAHLEPVTAAVNNARFRSGSDYQSRCRHGHPFDTANTLLDKDGSRLCRACRNAASLRYQARKRAVASDGR